MRFHSQSPLLANTAPNCTPCMCWRRVHSPTSVPNLRRSPSKALEEGALSEMQRIDSLLVGLAHETILVRNESVWSAVEKMLAEREIDLIVLGTHGRTGMMKLLLGSVAEEIFRRASVPVLTIGPSVRSTTHNGGRFFIGCFTPRPLHTKRK